MQHHPPPLHCCHAAAQWLTEPVNPLPRKSTRVRRPGRGAAVPCRAAAGAGHLARHGRTARRLHRLRQRIPRSKGGWPAGAGMRIPMVPVLASCRAGLAQAVVAALMSHACRPCLCSMLLFGCIVQAAACLPGRPSAVDWWHPPTPNDSVCHGLFPSLAPLSSGRSSTPSSSARRAQVRCWRSWERWTASEWRLPWRVCRCVIGQHAVGAGKCWLGSASLSPYCATQMGVKPPASCAWRAAAGCMVAEGQQAGYLLKMASSS